MRLRNRSPFAALAIALALGLLLAVPATQAASGGATAPGAGTSAGTTTSGGTTAGTTSTSTTSTGTTAGGSTAAGSTRSKSPSLPTAAGGTIAKRAGLHGPAPILTAASCYRVGKTSCSKKHHHTVQATGELVIGGHHFVGRITVHFHGNAASTASDDPVSAPLRPTPHGFAVTVPADAASGRIYLENTAGQHSNHYGPVTIKAAPVTVVATTVPVTGSPFDGAGMWIWYLADSDGGNLAAIAAQAKAAGITTLFIKSSDGPSDFWAQFTPALVQTIHSLGLDVCAWQYVYGADPAGEAAMGAEAVADGADCLVIDAESSYEDTGGYWAAQTYMTDLRAAIGPNYPVGLTSFPYVNEHPTLPYSVFLGAGGAQFNLPQIYWKDIGTTPDAAYEQTYIENRIYGRPIVPIGQSYGGVEPSQMTRFRQLAYAYGAIGFSFYSWQATSTAGWAALDTPITPATNVTIPTSWPALVEGDKGDQVLWMQEHLAAAEPTTPTSGDFDATTEANLLAFQKAEGLPRSGVPDAATWPALLQLTPVAVQFPEPPPTGSSGSTGASGASGTSGVSGSSGASGTGGTSA
jgi:hypothetical protein